VETVRVRIVVHGRVQGVWFRESARRRAVASGVAGWIRNLEDGAVEAVFEGPADCVFAMVSWAQEGPDQAHVTSLQRFSEDPEGLSEFSVMV
jgi:acylphosphatase